MPAMHTPAFGAALAAALTAALVAACSAGQPDPESSAPSDHQASTTTTGLIPPGAPTEGTRPDATDLPPPAEPQQAPPPQANLPGRQVQVGRAPEGVVVDARTRTVAVAKRDPDALVLLDADTGEVRTTTPLPGSVRHLQLAGPGGPVLVPVESANALVLVGVPGGETESEIITGTVPHDASQTPEGVLFVANELAGTTTVLRGGNDPEIVKIFTDSVQPAGMAPVGELMGMLDVRKNDLTVYDATGLRIVGSTPAGEGPTHLVADRHGRWIATDTRGDAIRVFDTSAGQLPRQIAEVAQDGGPYGITYDPVRDRLWVASSGTNEVIGYDMTDPTPREVARIATVQNPYSLGVDATTGRLFIAGVSAGVVQIVDPPPEQETG